MVNSRVRKTTRRHSLWEASFLVFVSSPSAFSVEGILNKDRSLVQLVERPKSAQLEPVSLATEETLKFTEKSSSLEDFDVAVTPVSYYTL